MGLGVFRPEEGTPCRAVPEGAAATRRRPMRRSPRRVGLAPPFLPGIGPEISLDTNHGCLYYTNRTESRPREGRPQGPPEPRNKDGKPRTSEPSKRPDARQKGEFSRDIDAKQTQFAPSHPTKPTAPGVRKRARTDTPGGCLPLGSNLRNEPNLCRTDSNGPTRATGINFAERSQFCPCDGKVNYFRTLDL